MRMMVFNLNTNQNINPENYVTCKCERPIDHSINTSLICKRIINKYLQMISAFIFMNHLNIY